MGKNYGAFYFERAESKNFRSNFFQNLKYIVLIKKVEKKNIFKAYLNILIKHVQFQTDYTKFSEYVKTRHILETAARKIQKYFRGRKVSKEKQFLLEEASVFNFK